LSIIKTKENAKDTKNFPFVDKELLIKRPNTPCWAVNDKYAQAIDNNSRHMYAWSLLKLSTAKIGRRHKRVVPNNASAGKLYNKSCGVALISIIYSSRAPASQTKAKPNVNSNKKSTADQTAKGPKAPTETAHGNSKTTSRSNTMKRIPIR
jgi:hypothetical protein